MENGTGERMKLVATIFALEAFTAAHAVVAGINHATL